MNFGDSPFHAPGSMNRDYIEAFLPEPIPFVGMDFGKAKDHSAWVALQRRYTPKGEPYNVDRLVPAKDLFRGVYGLKDEITEARVDVTYHYEVLDVQRLPLERFANRVASCEDAAHGHLLEGSQDEGGRGGRAGHPQKGRRRDLLRLAEDAQTLA